MSSPAASAVAIVGGGPAGAAAAIALARRGHTPLVLEADPEPRRKVGECLPPTANPLLAELGLTAAVERSGLPSYGNRSVWGRDEVVTQDFVFGTAGVGWRIDRDGFERELAGAAVAAGADWRRGWRLTGATRSPTGWTLRVDADGQRATCTADVVIDASGRAARLARLQGVRRIRHDRLVGAVCYLDVAPATERDSTTLVEAVRDGWWYSLFLPGDQLVVAFMTDADLLGPTDTAGLESRLDAAPATRDRLREAGVVRLPEPAEVRPAHTARLAEIVGPGWLAAGEAAVAFDPLSSYGITAALGSGYYAGEAAAADLAGDRDALTGYARMIDANVARYLVLVHDRYRDEQRWPDAPFWRRRHR